MLRVIAGTTIFIVGCLILISIIGLAVGSLISLFTGNQVIQASEAESVIIVLLVIILFFK